MKISVGRKSHVKEFKGNLNRVGELSAYVGIPRTTPEERQEKMRSIGTKRALEVAEMEAENPVNNAEVLFRLTYGDKNRNQPPRPVLEPAVKANSKSIGKYIAEAVQGALKGDRGLMLEGLERAALAGQNAAREWFTNPENGWAPNAPLTIKAKGSAQPGIDTGALRSSIVGIVGKED